LLPAASLSFSYFQNWQNRKEISSTQAGAGLVSENVEMISHKEEEVEEDKASQGLSRKNNFLNRIMKFENVGESV